jgi:carboxyl-terminal processing protease
MRISWTGIGLVVGVAFAAGAATGPAGNILLHPLAIRAALARSSDDTDHLLTLFSDVLNRVSADYVTPVSDRVLVDNALAGMLSGLDPHSAYMTEQQWHDMQTETTGAFGGIGLQVTDNGGLLEVISPIDDTPAAQAGIQPGDLITAVNGKTVEGLSLTAAVAEMRGPPDTTLQLTIKRQNTPQPLNFTLTRQIIHVQTVTSRLVGDIGVIRISEFTEQTTPGVAAALASLRKQAPGGLQGVVLDLRNDPGGLLEQAVWVANDFLDHGGIVSTKGRHAVDNENISATPSRTLMGNLPMVVLINNGTASAAEIVAGALQDNHRAVLLGTGSFGKGSVQTLIPMPGEGAIRLTTARYYTPSGRSIQGLGITPDVDVEESRTPPAHFGPEREADLLHILTNDKTTPTVPTANPADLPAAAKDIAKLPPPDWPTPGSPGFDPKNPATDFQLQQGLRLIRGMIAEKQVSR